MSSSQPLCWPKWSLHRLEPAGSGCGMEERAALPYCGWKEKLTVRFSDGLGGAKISFLPSPHISYNWDNGKSLCLFVLFSKPDPGTHLGCLNLCREQKAWFDLSFSCENKENIVKYYIGYWVNFFYCLDYFFNLAPVSLTNLITKSPTHKVNKVM